MAAHIKRDRPTIRLFPARVIDRSHQANSRSVNCERIVRINYDHSRSLLFVPRLQSRPCAWTNTPTNVFFMIFETIFFDFSGAEFDFARRPSTARLQKIELRPEKSAASRSAGTLMPGIMYLQMRNGLANSFPDHLSDRPDRRRALQILGPEAEKPDPNAFANQYETLSIEKT